MIMFLSPSISLCSGKNRNARSVSLIHSRQDRLPSSEQEDPEEEQLAASFTVMPSWKFTGLGILYLGILYEMMAREVRDRPRAGACQTQP